MGITADRSGGYDNIEKEKIMGGGMDFDKRTASDKEIQERNGDWSRPPTGLVYDKTDKWDYEVGSGRIENVKDPGYPKMQYTYPDDPIIEKVIQRVADRANKGMNKYATSMEDNHGGAVYWIDHAIEEALDLAAYLTKLKTIIEGDK